VLVFNPELPVHSGSDRSTIRVKSLVQTSAFVHSDQLALGTGWSHRSSARLRAAM
jgi:hypothetical protein